MLYNTTDLLFIWYVYELVNVCACYNKTLGKVFNVSTSLRSNDNKTALELAKANDCVEAVTVLSKFLFLQIPLLLPVVLIRNKYRRKIKSRVGKESLNSENVSFSSRQDWMHKNTTVMV